MISFLQYEMYFPDGTMAGFEGGSSKKRNSGDT